MPRPQRLVHPVITYAGSRGGSLIRLIAIQCVHFVRGCVDILSDVLFGIFLNKHQKRAPTIQSSLLHDSATSLARKIRTKEVKCEEVMAAFVWQMRRADEVLSVILEERFQLAIHDARAVDQWLATNTMRIEDIRRKKPLLGIPFTCQNSIAIKGFRLTCGLESRKDVRATSDAWVVWRLKNAGAIPVAVTSTPEMLLWWETANLIVGRSKNPYDTNRTPGGSGGGEGALLAAGGSAIGIGFDIGGGVRVSAFYNGVFGHKPSAGDKDLPRFVDLPACTGHVLTVVVRPCVGVMSNDGVYPVLNGPLNAYRTVGPMCRHAIDLMTMYRVMSDEKQRRAEAVKQHYNKTKPIV